ncbi:hypothetical protein D1614_17030 [Maribellus luteus]|uniref:Uncharacterized protein n=1 Tax=Maribellus luteus TaxID=2305463 RepID=A0A399SXB4_9BACT|nr:hypothetical protein [Maribellus luteus]RIJ46865.1 hypothetical protein D1614_17030 [Maribellus luteus]
MENKKLLKFLYKDIAEIEEIFAEKGKNGFDNFEVEFIQSRFAGAKQIIQILSEKENQFLKKTGQWAKHREELDRSVPSPVIPDNLHDEEFGSDETEEVAEENEEKGELSDLGAPVISDSIVSDEKADASTEVTENLEEEGAQVSEVPESDELEMDEDEEPVAGGQRLGDSFLKEKSVNDLMGSGNNKLENKISNSPVRSIQAAIGINDRYQYIRELFDGNAERFTEAVTDLDKMGSIQEAVGYLQLNYKWKKTDTSLKFVNLVKRRFANV